MTKQKGFTLIELIIVIVILGALAVVALPRFIDLTDEAEQAATEGVAGAISSAFAINYAGSLTFPDDSVGFGQVPGPRQYMEVNAAATLTDVSSVEAILQGQPLTQEGYTITDCDFDGQEPGATDDCTLTHPNDDSTATFTAIATEDDST